MSEVGAVQRYLYWSDRRIRELLNDLDIQPEGTPSEVRISTPSVGGLAPTAAWSQQRPTTTTRPQLARLVEEAIGHRAVETFDEPVGVQWVKGRSSMVFGEFVTLIEDQPRQALMYTRVIATDGTRVGICLFGNMRNYADFITESGTPKEEGWTSSAAPYIMRLLEERCVNPEYGHSGEELAYYALDMVFGQGLSTLKDHQDPPDALHGWKRSFTFGDVRDIAEWFAEVILDVTLDEDLHGHDRVIVAIPLWVRTASMKAVRLYVDQEGAEVDIETSVRRRWSRFRRHWTRR